MEKVPVEYEYEYEDVPEVKAPAKKKMINSAVLETRGNRNNDEKETNPKADTGNPKTSLFGSPRNPARLGIKLRRDPVGSSGPKVSKPIVEKVKVDVDVPAADVEYAYEDYPFEEVEKPERVAPVRQTRLPSRRQQQRQ